MTITDQLNLQKLTECFPNISLAFCECLMQACLVCFSDQGHEDGVILNVTGDINSEFKVIWPLNPISESIINTWSDPEVTTEHGAYGIAFLLIDECTDLTVTNRSYKTTGFDWWLGPKNASPQSSFMGKSRLEVSGIRAGNSSEIQTRIKRKIKQTDQSDNMRIPAVVVIVEFSRPESRFVRKNS
jgi:hypothetical protein